ncbi:MAG: alpha/beta hydrolase [Thermoprotei archaeon]
MKATINGANIYYEVLGSGEPLVLVEGWGYSSWMWYKQRVLASSLRLIIFDNRGVGLSDPLDHPYTMGEFAEDLQGLLDHIGVDKAYILGVSMGGMIALEFVLRHPKRVKGLVVCSTGPGRRGKPASQDVLKVMFESPSWDLRASVRRKMSVAFSKRFQDERKEEFEKVLDLRLPWMPSQGSLINQASAVADFDVLDRLKEIVCPTLIVAGTEDLVVPYENSLELHSRIAPSALHLFRGAGHLVFIECSEGFNRIVLRFIRDVEGAVFVRSECEEEC